MHFVYNETTVGGSDGYCKIIAKALKEKGHEVFVITTKPYKNLESLKASTTIIDGIKVYGIWPLLLNIPLYSNKVSNFWRVITFLMDFFNPYTYYDIKKILKKERPDVIYTNDLIYLSLSVFPAAKSLNIPIVSAFHCYQVICPLKGHLLCINKKVCKHPTLICKIYAKINEFIIGDSLKIGTFDSKASLKRHAEENIFLDKKKVIFPSIFDIKNMKPDKEEQIYSPDDSFDILFVGRLSPDKGIDTLIKAVKKTPNDNIRLHICGEDISQKDLFKNLAKNDKRIIFYGKVSEDKLKKLRKLCDVAVYPSIIHESFGRIIVESFFYGLPVIGSNIGAIPELIEAGYNGFLFEPGNVEELKDILEKVINNKEKLKEMSKNCINTAKKYSVENNIYKLEEIYKEAIKLKQKK